jgi:hypothetical protein
MASRWEQLRNEELHNLYTLQNIISISKSKSMRQAERVQRMGDINAFKILVRKPELRRQFGRPRLKLEGNIKVEIKEMRK